MNPVTDHQSEETLFEAAKLAGPFLLGIAGMALNLIFIIVGKNLATSPELVIHFIGTIFTAASYATFAGAAILALLNIRNMTKATNLLTQ